MVFNIFGYIFFLVAISFVLAKLEINIEGRNGWAKNLPTWRISNSFTKLIYGDSPLTGYHLWLMAFMFVFLHFPFFVGLQWKLSNEFLVISLFFSIWFLEDFLWFVLNPHFGIKKFNKNNIPWHTSWLGHVPIAYFKFATVGLIFLAISFL